jgi:hypothetical protein
MNKVYLKQIIKQVFLEVASEKLKTPKVPEGDWTKAEFATDEKPVYALKESPEELTASDNMFMLDEEFSEYHNMLRDALLDKIRETYSNMVEPEDKLNQSSIISSITDDFIGSDNPNYSEIIAQKVFPLLGLTPEQIQLSIDTQDPVYIQFLGILETMVVDYLEGEYDDAVETVTSDYDNDSYPSDAEIWGTR